MCVAAPWHPAWWRWLYRRPHDRRRDRRAEGSLELPRLVASQHVLGQLVRLSTHVVSYVVQHAELVVWRTTRWVVGVR